MSNAADYHADKDAPVASLSSSIAKILITQSPLHAWTAHPRLNPDYREQESDTFDYGTAAHAMLLEGDQSGLVIVEADDWRKKEAREARDNARAAGKTPILARQLAKVQRMVEAACLCIEASEFAGILERGTPEHTIRWQESGAHLRSRLDLWDASTGVILDYKSAADASPEGFNRVIPRMGYDFQGAFYRRGILKSGEYTGNSDPRFILFAQEKEPPYDCTFHGIAPSMAEIADAQVERAIQIWGECMRTRKWPGYSKRVHHAEATAWQMAMYEAQIAEEK